MKKNVEDAALPTILERDTMETKRRRYRSILLRGENTIFNKQRETRPATFRSTSTRALEPTGRCRIEATPTSLPLYSLDSGYNPSAFTDRDIIPTLDKLSRRVLLGLISTDSAQTARVKIERSGLGVFFHAMFIADEIDLTAANPLFFLNVSRNLDLPPHEILYITSEPASDSAGARESGYDVCWYNNEEPLPSFREWEPDYIISDLRETLVFAPLVS